MGTWASVAAFVSILKCSTSETTHRAIIHGKGSDIWHFNIYIYI